MDFIILVVLVYATYLCGLILEHIQKLNDKINNSSEDIGVIKAFKTQLRRKEERGWDKIYILMDVHECFLYPNYNGPANQFYKDSEDVLRYMSEREDFCLILWTCSRKEELKKYLKLCIDKSIKFDYINDNPEVRGKLNWGDYDAKLYTNIIFDDKAGLDPETDWTKLKKFFRI